MMLAFDLSKSLLRLMFVAIMAPATSMAGIINVPADYATVQEALDNAQTGDEVVLAPGTYHENVIICGKDITLRSTDPDDEDIVASTIIMGTQETNDASVVMICRDIEGITRISGLSITGGRAQIGGGINARWAFGSKSAIISKNIIHSNIASAEGGGIFAITGDILDNKIYNNFASRFTDDEFKFETVGGGIASLASGRIEGNHIYNNKSLGYFHSSRLGRVDGHGGGIGDIHADIVRNNIIENNEATGYGGGAYQVIGMMNSNTIHSNKADLGGGLFWCEKVFNNIISQNEAETSGGIYSLLGDDYLVNNLIIGNTAEFGGGIGSIHFFEIYNNVIYGNIATDKIGGITGFSGANANNIIWGNSAPMYSNLAPSFVTVIHSVVEGFDGEGINVRTSDPMFVNPSITPPYDFSLSPESSYIDQGSTFTLPASYYTKYELKDEDIFGNPRVVKSYPFLETGEGNGIDIGAVEYQGIFEPSDYFRNTWQIK